MEGKLSNRSKIILAVLLQLAILLIVIFSNLIIIARGTDVMLRVRPIDPRDPLRGDYVTFDYYISEVYASSLSGSADVGDTIYVPLKKVGKYWDVSGQVYTNMPEDPKNGEVYLKGVVKNDCGNNIRDYTYSCKLQVEYKDIQEYFIPEGKGSELNWSSNVMSKITVDKNGNAVLRELFINDKPWP